MKLDATFHFTPLYLKFWQLAMQDFFLMHCIGNYNKKLSLDWLYRINKYKFSFSPQAKVVSISSQLVAFNCHLRQGIHLDKAISKLDLD